MGCTAEAVYLDGRNVVVGHVGDSRTYHLSEGRLIQLTRDQTLVNRLVELGTLTPEEAETHPRRNELQQAVGGQPDVEPGDIRRRLEAGRLGGGLFRRPVEPRQRQLISRRCCSRRRPRRRWRRGGW